MDTIESLKTIAALLDGLTTIGFAVWFITMLVAETREIREDNKHLIDFITKQNEQLIGLLREDIQSQRFAGVLRGSPSDTQTRSGLD